MAREEKKSAGSQEKQWENPKEPSSASDDRDQEQLLRQYKEARRLKDNLTGEEEKTDKKTDN